MTQPKVYIVVFSAKIAGNLRPVCAVTEVSPDAALKVALAYVGRDLAEFVAVDHKAPGFADIGVAALHPVFNNIVGLAAYKLRTLN